MAGIPDKIRSNLIRNTVTLTRYEAGLQADVLDMVEQLGQDLLRGLLGAGLDTPNTAWQRARLQAMLKEAKATINAAYGDMGEWHASEMSGLVQVSGRGITTAMNDAIGARLMVPPKWTKEQLRAIASDVLIDGAPSATWWDRQASDLMEDFADSMRKGMMRGESIVQMRDRIMGQDLPGVNAVGKINLNTIPVVDRAVIKAARKNAEALVRTSVIATNNTAHLAAYQANSDIMGGFEWLSVLDGRTTIVCRGLSGLRWDMKYQPIGHSIAYPGPTAHWGCRSQTMGVTKSWEDLAREAGGNTRLARELDKIPRGSQASMGGQVSGDLKYEDWFATQPEKWQRQTLGPGRFRMWQEGKLGFADMIDQRSNPLTLRELESMVG